VDHDDAMTMLEAITRAFDQHDLEGILAHFTDDAVFDAPRGPDPWGTRFVGLEAIRKGFAGRFAGIPDILATDWLSLPPIVWWVVLYLAVGPTAICFFLIQYASLRLPAPKVIAYGYLTPAFVILFEAIAGHGWPSLSIMAGAMVTVLGLIVLAAVRD